MSTYVLTTCSTADYERDFFAQRTIPYVCYHYEIDGQEYVDDLYESTTPAEFYGRLKAGGQSKTSQVGVGEYQEFWEPYLAQGLDVVHVTLSSGISGSYNSACLAASALAERYPDRTIKVVDSLAASSGFGMLVEYMADLRDQGATLDELVDWAETNKYKLNHWFFVSDLDCLKRGGRVSATQCRARDRPEDLPGDGYQQPGQVGSAREDPHQAPRYRRAGSRDGRARRRRAGL